MYFNSRITNFLLVDIGASPIIRSKKWTIIYSSKLLYSVVAQWWSTRLLTDRLEVRALSTEPLMQLV